MAEQNISTKGFDKSLNTDVDNYLTDKSDYSYARNAINNSSSGDLGSIGNEPSNKFCINTPYTIIGFIYLFEDRWAVFSTDNINSEIGLFIEGICSYTKIVNDNCLNFNTSNLVTGISKQNFDCTRSIYWSDGHRNPDRVLNIDKVPYIQDCGAGPGNPPPIGVACPICIDTPNLDCNRIKLNPIINYPCIKTNRSNAMGSLANGTYYATIAYSVNGQKVTDYFSLSNPTSIFVHSNLAGSLDVNISNLDVLTYQEYELVIIAIVNSQTRAFKLGNYNTTQTRISFDVLNPSLITVPIEFLPIRNPLVDSSDHITQLGDYMIRVQPKSKFDFNYQPIANNIQSKWVSVEYPAEYYKNSGENLSYLRDEVYAFFIQFIYDDGDLSSSYHIPNNSTGFTFTPMIIPVDNEGFEIAEGTMIPWTSTELYPNNPSVWGALCGQPIRHHKFPSQADAYRLLHYVNYTATVNGEAIRVLGVKFDNIKPPLDLAGNVITNIVGYRILRGDREGNKTIIAKGLVNNLLQSNDIPKIGGVPSYIPNYPYNDIRTGFPDPFLSYSPTSTGWLSGTLQNSNGIVLGRRDIVTFHSPDTQFKKPYLSPDNINYYLFATGISEGNFVFPEEHPKYKLVTNLLFYAGAIAGFGLAIQKQTGTTSTETFTNPNFLEEYVGVGGGVFANLPSYVLINSAQVVGSPVLTGVLSAESLLGNSGSLAALAGSFIGPNTLDAGLDTYRLISGTNTSIKRELGISGNMSTAVKILGSLPMFVSFWEEGYSTIVNAIKNGTYFRNLALQYQSTGFYSNYETDTQNTPFSINDAAYLGSTLQSFINVKINNLYRGETVIVNSNANLPTIESGVNADDSKFKLGDVAITKNDWERPTETVHKKKIGSFYAGLKINLANQYGQIGQVRQLPTSCIQNANFKTALTNQNFTSDVLFGGDTYITRYAERNTMYFFTQWLYQQPNGYEYDYLLFPMTAYPTYWVNSIDIDLGEIVVGFVSNITSFSSLSPTFPTTMRALDSDTTNYSFGGLNLGSGPSIANKGFFIIKNAYFYLFNSGVRDFYVESEVNTFFRDWEDGNEKRFYDHTKYNSKTDLFRVPHIRYQDYYKYDYSLSAGKNFINSASWANIQPNYYDPNVAATCYVKHPRRLIYSLQQQYELIVDSWRVYLANNYKDFRTEITTIKDLGQSGAIIFFQSESPIMIRGVETLETDLGTKITIGDGSLFNQPLQSLSNSEKPYEYGSCQNLRSIINTPAGVFWISQNQGKIFSISEGMMELTMQDLRWWFSMYLPYQITIDFPNFDISDNAVVGVDCQSIYNNQDALLYFTKKDYRKRQDLIFDMTYTPQNGFIVNGVLPVKLGDPLYFEDCSWTISYDPKTKAWVSWHDWHPNFLMPNKNTFLSIQDRGMWLHNEVCDSYANYYGVDYPFEIEYISNTVQTVNTIRSIEYQLEVYKYDKNCHDRFMFLDENFDEAVIYNMEQVSGLLKLNNQPKNNPFAIINYPIVNPSSIDILYSKVENKYRFNQFWDITDDRGEFTTAQRMIWNTAGNGYVRTLNTVNLNYSKSEFQSKKFRGYSNTVLMKKKVSSNKKFLVNIFNNKQLYSPR